MTNLSPTTGLRLRSTHSIQNLVSVHTHAFDSKYQPPDSMKPFSAADIRFPLTRKMTAILGRASEGLKQTCREHCRLSNPDPGWLTHTFLCRFSGLRGSTHS